MPLATAVLVAVLAGVPVGSPDAAGEVRPCTASPEYYQIELVTTRRVPGTAWSRGTAAVTFTRSPFTVAVASDGSYRHDLHITADRLPARVDGVFAVWITTPQLDEVVPVGLLDPADPVIAASVDWNQFLVVVSLEPSAEAVGERWSGPIVMRGLSRSGLMHTMAGHGPFQQENCAAYGY